jgi:integrase
LIWRDLKLILKTFGPAIKDKRDKAILMFGFASGGRRRSEIAAAKYKDLHRIRGGYLYELPRSKTDQEGKGEFKPILKSASKALTQWLKVADIADGFIFRQILSDGSIADEPIQPRTVNFIIKQRVEMIGLDPALYGAHSLRSGFMTESGLRKEPLGEAMELSGHKTAQVALGYYQAGRILQNPTARMID